jgi:hypothetical protein
LNQPKPAIEQFSERGLRILSEYFTPFKYANQANASFLASLFPTDSFMPSDQMFVTEARLRIASGQIRETADWTEAFREFHAVTQGAYSLDCNLPILEKALQGRKPMPELLVQIASDHASQLVMTNEASDQAAQDQKHEALFHKLAPRLITDIPAGSNRYAVALENKRIEERRQQLWDMSLEQLEAIDAKRSLRDLSKEELKKIANSMDPARIQREFSGERNTTAEPEQVLKIRAQGAEEVRQGRHAALPPQWRVPGKEVYLDWSFGLLNQLPKEMVKQLLEKYGDSQITAACHTTRYRLLQKQQGQ